MRFVTLLALAASSVAALPAADVNAGVKSFQRHDFDAAANSFREALRADDHDVRARAYLALTLLEQDKKDEAKAECAKLADSDAPEANVARAQCKAAAGDEAGAVKLLEDAVREADTGLARYYVGLAHMKANNNKQAAEDFEKVIEKDPDFVYAYYYAGMAYSRLKQPDKMLNRYQMFLKQKPDAPEADRIRALTRSMR